ncbi:hypothetical protein [uncultured Aquimarina sp.]|uniref:hypothetical protein n=1 Tax=uncultured Aquimarina sp. TaxID=575652 RepID=UPI0026283CA6|nr:hypothetical protein [uncultured Aquimarina sp.]
MKTQNIFFRNVNKVVLVLSILFMASCGSDDDGTEVGFVELPATLLTSYTGVLGYNPVDGSGITENTSGTATLSRSGNTYTVSFSDGVPSLTGITFITGSNGTFSSASTGSSSDGIVVGEDDLRVGVQMSGNTWSFATN